MKQKKKNYLLISSIIILILGLGLIFAGIKVLSKPKVIFSESVKYITKPINMYKTNSNILKQISANDKIKYSSDINVKLNNELNLGLNNLNFKLEILENKTDKVSKYYFDSKLDEQKLLEATSYFRDNKLYLTISDIFDKYYYTNVDYVSLFDTSNIEDSEVILKIFKDSISSVLTDDKFVKEKFNVDIDGTYEATTRLSLKVTDKLLEDILAKTITDIKNNENAINALANLSQSDKSEIITMLDEYQNENNTATGELFFTYNIYYKNINTIRKLEIISGDEIITYTGNNNTYKLKYDEKVNNIFTLSMVSDKKGNSTLSLTSDSLNVNGSITKNNNIYHVVLNFKDNNDTNLGSLGINYVKESDQKNEINVNYKFEEQEIISLTVKSEYSFGENITIPDLSTSKDFNMITEDETNNIMNNLSNHPVFGSLFQMFASELM